MQSDKLFKGIIIEESLSDKDILKKCKIIETQVSEDNNPATNAGERIWTLQTVEIQANEIKSFVKSLSENIKLPNWWADLGSDDEIYIIFHKKIFHGSKTDGNFRKMLKDYATEVKLPEGQIPLS